jgi:hypothetical protein
MTLFSEETLPWVNDTAAAALGRHVLETAPRPADAIYAVPSRKVDAGSRRVSAFTLASLARRSLFAGTVCLLGGAWLGGAWLGGSHFLGIHRTIVQEVGKEGAEQGHSTQNTTEDVHDQQADLGGMRAAQSLNTEDVAGHGNTKPRPDAAKTEISSGIADVSDKVAYSGSKSADNVPKVGGQPDRIGLEIAALHAAAPVADRSLSLASVAPRRTRRERGDAFDPSKNPNAPGAPRPLGTIARPATANYASAEYSSARVVPRTRRERGDAFDPSKNPNAPSAPRPLGTIARTTTANSASASNQRQTASSPSL